MLFKARKKTDFASKILNILWPKKGWKRLLIYISLRVKRLPGSSHSIALGFTFGVMAAMTPLFGLHFIIGIILAWIFGVSIIASLIGNFVGNPWTFPFICILNYKVGSMFYSSDNISNISMKLISNELYLLWNAFYTFFMHLDFEGSYKFISALQLIPPMIIGSAITIFVIFGPCYLITKFIINNYKKSKLKLLNKSIEE